MGDGALQRRLAVSAVCPLLWLTKAVRLLYTG